jgi:hypothetical protein
VQRDTRRQKSEKGHDAAICPDNNIALAGGQFQSANQKSP